jgi:outer membrane protein TolC
MKGIYSKKQLLLATSLLLLGTIVQAQKKYAITADSAVIVAFNNVTEIKNLQIDSLLQFQKNKEITGSAFPQIAGTVSSTHYFSIPVTVLPDFISPSVYGVLTHEGVKDGSGNTIKTPSSFGTFPAQFGVPWSASAGISVNQLLFQPDVFIGLKARSKAIKYVSDNIQVMKDSIKSNVYRSYYAVVIAEKRLSFLKDGLKRLQKLYSDQDVMFKNGFIERLDLDKTQVNLNNLLATEKQVENGVGLGYAALKFALGLTQKDTLILKDTLSNESIKKGVLDYKQFAYEDRPEIRLLNTVKELQQLDVQRYKLQYIPTIAAFWNYSKNAQRQQFDFFNKGDWFTTNMVGVNMSVPIWNGGQREAKIKQAKLTLDKTNNSISQFKQVIDLQTEAARVTLVNSLSSLDIQERNTALAERVYLLTKKKYEQGLGSSFEVLQVEQSLQDAQNNYFQSLYDAVIAKVGLLKATGKL